MAPGCDTHLHYLNSGERLSVNKKNGLLIRWIESKGTAGMFFGPFSIHDLFSPHKGSQDGRGYVASSGWGYGLTSHKFK